jgi:hypothetical protein
MRKKPLVKNECAEETHRWGNFKVMIALPKGECKKRRLVTQGLCILLTGPQADLSQV